MNEEDEIKQKMLQQKMQEQQAEDALKEILPKVLDKSARERLSTVKTVKPQLALQLQVFLLQLYQSGQIPEPLSEEMLIKILQSMSQKRDIQIKRK